MKPKCLAVTAFVLLPGCAAASPPAAMAPAPPAVVAAPPPPPPPNAIAPSSLVEQDLPTPTPATRALLEMQSAQHELEASTGNCRAACKALGSMDSAAGRLCGLASSADERRECDDSRAKVLASRARVAASFGTCPSGPSLDPHAPVPSPSP